MAQSTAVVQFDPARGAELQSKLESSGYRFRTVAHALFSAAGDGVVATLYKSGKLVVQGRDPASFLERELGIQAGGPAASGPAKSLGPILGSDESGKGDYFGPLIVAGVRLTEAEARSLEGGPIVDSKRLADETVRRLGASLRSRFPHALARLDPPAYNELHARVKNLNPMLADLHASVIRELARPGIHVLVDQFAREELLRSLLSGLDIRLEQRPRAEENVAVAAASILAREEFLRSLDVLSQEFAIDLHKGAGPPVERAAKRFVALHGQAKLGQVAKLHFRTTGKVSPS